MKRFLTLPVPISDEEKKINFYFHTSLWCLKMFSGGLKGLKLTLILFQQAFQKYTGLKG